MTFKVNINLITVIKPLNTVLVYINKIFFYFILFKHRSISYLLKGLIEFIRVFLNSER